MLQRLLVSRCEVVEFGGGLGGTYINNRDVFPSRVDYTVIEQPSFVACGNMLSKEYDLPIRFKDSWKDICQNPCLIVFSAVLQYIEYPYEAIMSAVKLNPEFILIDRTSFGADEKWRIQVNKDYYDEEVDYPFQRIDKKKIFTALENYKLLEEWSNPFDPIIPKHTGLLFKNLTPRLGNHCE